VAEMNVDEQNVMKMLTRELLKSALIRLCAAALLLILPGCVVGPKYHPPAPPQAPAVVYKESPANSNDSGDWTVAQPADAKLRGKWWEIFNDPDLNALEEQLDINNQNIKQFFENFMAARAIVREARTQSEEILERARKTGEATERQAQEQAEKRRDQLMEQTRREIDGETRRAIQEIRREVADLTVMATEKVTRKVLDDDDQRRLVEDALNELDFSALAPRDGS